MAGGYPTQGAALLPGMGNRQEEDHRRRATAPTPSGLGLPGMQSRAENAAADGLALPGMQSRGSMPAQVGGGLAIPGIGRSDPAPSGGGLALPFAGRGGGSPANQIKGPFVTDTTTTPRDRQRRKGGPVKLTSMEPDGGVRIASTASMEFDRMQSSTSRRVSTSSALPVMKKMSSTTSQTFLPKWASLGGKGGGGILDAQISYQGSLQSEGVDSSFLSWAPQAFVQSWHQKLGQKYQDYNMVNMVGEGRHGAVFIVQHKQSEQYYACKLLNKSHNEVKNMRQEIEAMKRLDHPNIVRLFETLEDSENVFLLMELCHGGDLFSLITSQEEGRLTQRASQQFGDQMLSALAYCHTNGFVHRDVKPENFLLHAEGEDVDSQTLKLADFGIATSIRPVNMVINQRSQGFADWDGGIGHHASNRSYQFVDKQASIASGMSIQHVGSSYEESEMCGSLPYMAPELLSTKWKAMTQDKNKAALYSASVDCWSTGIVIYVMLSGDLPFGSDAELICSGRAPPFEAEVWRSINRSAKDLILKLVSHKVEDRWTASRAVRHEWLTAALPDDGYPRLSAGSPEAKRELAIGLLNSLRRWSNYPKLRRIAFGSIAKRLEGDHPAQKMAETIYRTFGDASSNLRCDSVVQAMKAALADGDVAESPYTAQGGYASASTGSSPSERGSQHTRTGMHLRQKVGATKMVEKMKEFTNLGSERRSDRSDADSATASQLSADGVSMSELRVLVNMLDSMKSGCVVYTLLVACYLTPDVYSDERKIKEVFEMFDVRKKGRIGPQDLAEALGRHKENSVDIKKLSDSIAVFDLNNDGTLDFREFRLMVRGEQGGVPVTHQTSQSRTAHWL
mmetsp:Transcript_54661/g.127841  ORF Transcript_54661/g.127841 Transcript_54661/m.127841 type:complete len:849 (-) Transcript_54661:79-2625(-)